MTLSVLLSVGDADLANSLDLLDRTRHAIRHEGGGIQWPPPAEGAKTRTVTIPLRIYGATADDAWTHHGDIEQKLNQARRQVGAYGIGANITLSVQLDTAEWVYFDVLDGSMSVSVPQPRDAWLDATLTLVCLPYARGDAYTVGPSGTLTNGTGATYTIEDVPGDADALVRLTISDVSTTSKVINRLRIGRRSLPSGMTASDFTGVVDATAVSPGTSSADATAIGGARSRVTTSGAWQSIASIAKPAAQYTVGLFNVLVRARDSAVYPGMPFNVAATIDVPGSSSLAAGTHQFKIVALDASTNLSVASQEVTIFLPTANTYRVNLTWTVPTNGSTVTNHRMYSRVNGGSWGYKSTASASGAFAHNTAAGFTTSDPPTIPSNHPSQVRGQLSLASGTTQTKTRPVYCALSNSQWELIDLGTHPLPPQQALEAGTPLDWLLTLQGINTSGTPTLDIDGAWLIPADEAATTVWVDGLALATARDWIIDTRRDGAVTAYRVQTGTNTEAGGLLTSAPFTLGPGTNVLVFAMDGIDGESDIADLKAIVSARIVPLYRLLAGGA